MMSEKAIREECGRGDYGVCQKCGEALSWDDAAVANDHDEEDCPVCYPACLVTR